jgi:hypothetical protein
MTRKKIVLRSLLGVALICGGALFAQRPVENIDSKQHPHLAAAQHHIKEAFDATEASEKYYKNGLGGHGDKAKQHLVEADQELKLAAEFADHHK